VSGFGEDCEFLALLGDGGLSFSKGFTSSLTLTLLDFPSMD